MAIYQIVKLNTDSTWHSTQAHHDLTGLIFATDKNSIVKKVELYDFIPEHEHNEQWLYLGDIIPLNNKNYFPLAETISVFGAQVRCLFK